MISGGKWQNSRQNGPTTAFIKKGSQHRTKVPVIIASVLAAFLSLFASSLSLDEMFLVKPSASVELVLLFDCFSVVADYAYDQERLPSFFVKPSYPSLPFFSLSSYSSLVPLHLSPSLCPAFPIKKWLQYTITTSVICYYVCFFSFEIF